MKWKDLRPGDIVSNNETHETCLLLGIAGRFFTWFVLHGHTHIAWGSNPYTVETTENNFDIDPTWEVFQRPET